MTDISHESLEQYALTAYDWVGEYHHCVQSWNEGGELEVEKIKSLYSEAKGLVEIFRGMAIEALSPREWCSHLRIVMSFYSLIMTIQLFERLNGEIVEDGNRSIPYTKAIVNHNTKVFIDYIRREGQELFTPTETVHTTGTDNS